MPKFEFYYTCEHVLQYICLKKGNEDTIFEFKEINMLVK